MTIVSGTVIPYKEVNLAAQIPGSVIFLAGREGQSFKAGEPLVAIDDSGIRAKREAAVASAMAAEATLRNANVQYSREIWSPRTGKPTGMGFPSMMDQFFSPFTGQYAGPNNPWVERGADLYSSAHNVDAARSQLLAARAQIEEIDSKLRDARLVAPFDGVIAQRMVEIGTTVQPGQLLMRFAHVAYLRIQSEVPVRLLSSLSKGQVVSARVDVGGGINVPARVSQIFPVANQERHTVTVKFDLPKGVPGGPGMYAEVQLPDPAAQSMKVTSVPQDAVFQRGSLPAVIAVKDGRTSLRLVRVGGPLSNGRVAILSGLEGNEQVIVADPSQLATMPIGEPLPPAKDAALNK
jgi:multidrug efflux pump subunit AcrA (membrane-fusion protein)